jgi:hypothetical protein
MLLFFVIPEHRGRTGSLIPVRQKPFDAASIRVLVKLLQIVRHPGRIRLEILYPTGQDFAVGEGFGFPPFVQHIIKLLLIHGDLISVIADACRHGLLLVYYSFTFLKRVIQVGSSRKRIAGTSRPG